MKLLNPLKDIQDKAKKLKSKVDEEPEEVHTNLMTMLKPAIKIGNQFGNPEPEKELYKTLKDIDPEEDQEELKQAIQKWSDSR